MPTPRDSYRSWLNLLGVSLISFPSGIPYCYGNVAPYSASYSRKYAIDRRSSNETIIGGSLWIGSTGLGMCVGILLGSRFGCRKVIAAASLILTLATLGLALSLRVSFTLFLFTFSGVVGFSCGLGNGPAVWLAISWLPNRKGLASGISQGMYALYSVIFSPLETWFINPANEAPDQLAPVDHDGGYVMYYTQESILRRVPYCFVIQAGISAIFLAIGLILIRDPPSDTDEGEMETLLDRGAQNPEDKDGSRFDESDALNEQGHAAASGCTSEEDFALINSGSACKDSNHNRGPLLNHYTDRTLRQETGRHSDVNEMSTLTNSSMTACQTAKARNEESTNVPGELSWSFSGLSVDTRHIFNHLYTWQVLSVIASVIISALSFASVYKTFGETFIHDDMFLAVVGSVSAICNVMGHILGGFAMDYLRVKDVLPTIPAVLSALLLSVSASVHGGKTMYFVWNCGILFIIGVFFAAHPIFVIRAYGAQHFASNLSFFLFSWICFGVIGSFLLSWIKDLLSWPGIFIFLGSLPGGAMMFSMFMNIKNPWGHYI